MKLTITHSNYYIAVKRDSEFVQLRRGCKIRKFATEHLQFQYANVSYASFAQEYSSEGWIKRKLTALPMTVWSILKIIYHLVKACIHCRKQNCYKAYRELQAGSGHFISLFNDCYGSYHIQASAFHKECYDLFRVKKIEPMSLRSLEEMNMKNTDKGYEGSAIFVDITSDGGEQAIQSIKEQSICKMNGPKTCHFGLACCFNFSIAIANKSSKIILFDYDPIVVRFNRILRDQLKLSSNKADFKTSVISACRKDKEISKRKFFPKTSHDCITIDNLGFILNRHESCFSNEEDFRLIKTMAEAGDIHILQGNIYDEKMIKNIAIAAKAERVQFNSLFISNVYDWDSNSEKRNRFIKNMARLSNDKTLIVDVIPLPDNHWAVNVAPYIDPKSKQLYRPNAFRQGAKQGS